MKKYLLLVSALTLIAAGIYYLFYFEGSLYFPHSHENGQLHTNFQVENRQIINSKKQPFIVKGVDMNSSLPGHHSNEFAIDKKTYLDWFDKISAMGANTIRVKTVMDVDFYNALAQHNAKSSQPLYLLQGIRVSDYTGNSAITGTDKKYQGKLIEDAKLAVDVVHGRKQVWNKESGGSDHYRKDISKWVLGFIVGESWNSGTVAYTNHQENAKPFKGEFFATNNSANTFEMMLAEVMDELMTYETEKYNWQHLISFANSPLTDPFEYRKPFAAQAPKYAQLNIEKIHASKKVKSGVFASYQVADFHPKFRDYLLLEPLHLAQNTWKDIQKSPTAQAYVKLLNAYHKKLPVMVTGYGYSTSRGIDQTKIGDIRFPISEQEQGKYLVSDYKSFIQAGSVGATINGWQDDWNSSSWNTSFATNQHANFLWHDVQVVNASYGLLSFKNRDKIHVLNGKKDKGEWQEALLKTADGQLMIDRDETYLYFAIEKKNPTDNKWLVPIDMTPKSGSKVMERAKVKFQKPADFVVKIDGEKNSQLLVQERYNASKENYSMQTEAVDSYVRPPAKDSPVFNMVEMVLKNTNIFEDIEKANREDKWLPKYETGKLRAANGERGAKDFDSRADINFGEKVIEGRIPLQLLNFSNPAENKIHDDYYEKYGVKELAVRSIALGLGKMDDSHLIKMENYSLKTWEKPQVTSTLKSSYEMVKAAWTGKEK